MTIDNAQRTLPELVENLANMPHLEPFTLKNSTQSQEQAIRDLARQAGFKDLRGFHNWMKAADITYYDLIKVASPE